jgi:hypothetical protein
LAFGTKAGAIPSAVPYLRARSESVFNWGKRLGAKERPRIGAAWLSDHRDESYVDLSIPLSTFVQLSSTNALFVGLHRTFGTGDEALLRSQAAFQSFDDAFENLSEAAALMMNLDLIITVDSTIAHLASAIGKPVWVLLPHTPDWPWSIDRDTTPWYPTVRQFRRNRTAGWDEVITQVRGELIRTLGSNRR